MVHFICSVCEKSSPTKRSMRNAGESNLWSVISGAMVEINKTCSPTSLICQGCYAFVKVNEMRHGVVNLQSRIDLVTKKRPSEIPSKTSRPSRVVVSQSQNSTFTDSSQQFDPASIHSHGSGSATTVSMFDSQQMDANSVHSHGSGSATTVSMFDSQLMFPENAFESQSLSSASAFRDFSQDANISIDTHGSLPQPESTTTQRHLTRVQVSILKVPGIPSTITTESRCFICNKPVRTRISRRAIVDLWLKRAILIPENNRCCTEHMVEELPKELLKPEIVNAIAIEKPYSMLTGRQVGKWMTTLRKVGNTKVIPIDFENNSAKTDKDYRMLLGVTKEQFGVLLAHCQPTMRDSPNRSVRSALAIFLMKLRLNLSQSVLAFLFGIRLQSIVSETIAAVLKALLESFVPKHTEFGHLSKEELIQQHMRPFFSSILNTSPNSVVLILDGTYLFVQKSSDFALQKKSFSMHKKRNLFKPMMVVCPDGYILDATGLFYGDSGNNDANILLSMMKQRDQLMSVLEDGDVMILDRGFRDAIDEVEAQGIQTFMPQLLKKGQAQFTTEEANLSRLVTILRWIVESANGRLKNVFKFFDDAIAASYFPKLPGFLRVAIAILNAFYPPLFVENDWHAEVIQLVADRLHSVNTVQAKVVELELRKNSVNWLSADEDDVLEFPSLNLDELKRITIGPYQLRIGLLYNHQHAPNGRGYEFYIHRELEGLIRLKLKSRFTKKKHFVWVEFLPMGTGVNAILGWYCLCKNGARTLGCCGHVAAVLRFLSHDRFELPTRRRTLDREGYIDAAPNKDGLQPENSQTVEAIQNVVDLLEDSSDDEDLSDVEDV